MSTLKADTIQSTGGGAATLTKQNASKQWAYYDSQALVIRGSLNTASMVDNAAGDQTLNFSNAFDSATNMAFAGVCTNNNSANKHQAMFAFTRSGSDPTTTTSGRFSTAFDGQTTTIEDMDFITVIGNGDLA